MTRFRLDAKKPPTLTTAQKRQLVGKAIDDSDIPALGDDFFAKKKQLTIRLDADVLEWLKSHGRGYQTRINRILRVVMEKSS